MVLNLAASQSNSAEGSQGKAVNSDTTEALSKAGSLTIRSVMARDSSKVAGEDPILSSASLRSPALTGDGFKKRVREKNAPASAEWAASIEP